jgi:hypothetical protein
MPATLSKREGLTFRAQKKMKRKKENEFAFSLMMDRGENVGSSRLQLDDCFSRFTYCIHNKKILIAVAVLSTMIARADGLVSSGHK